MSLWTAGPLALTQNVAFEIATRAGGGSGGGRSSSGGGGSSSSRSSSGGSTFIGGSGGSGGGAFGAIFGLLCLGVVGLIIFLLIRNALKKGGMSQAGLPTAAGMAGAVQGMQGTQLGSNPEAGRITNRANVDAGIAGVQQHDPAFNEADFLSDCNRAFFTIQQAWTERKPDISRQVMHDGVWQQHKFQIDQYLSQNKQNILENLAIQNTRMVSVTTDESFDTIVVRFFASCADYYIELADGTDKGKNKIVRGDRSVNDWAEDWIFQRKSTAVTKPNGGTMAKKCPNCGAPLDLDLAGICKYCRAPVMSGEFDWVLTRIEQLPNYEYAQQSLPT